MKAFTFSVLALVLSVVGSFAHADLFYNTCEVAPQSAQYVPMGAQIYYVSTASNFGMTCDSIRTAESEVYAIKTVLSPVSGLILGAEVKAALMGQIAGLGLAELNPVVLSVTVLGGIGISVVHLVLRQSLAECEKMDKEEFRKSIMDELDRKLRIKGNPTLEIQH